MSSVAVARPRAVITRAVPRVYKLRAVPRVYKLRAVRADKLSSKAQSLPVISDFRDEQLQQVIPNFRGNQYYRDCWDKAGYMKSALQYATTSHVDEHRMDPAIVAHPSNVDDIKSAVQYAKDNNIAIAIKTGGHQYSGASSTSGPNIQLDVSKTFKDGCQKPDLKVDEKNGKYFVTTSVSWQLIDINEALGAKGLFVPHGQCCHVHIGGHAHTGGYGQLGRSFGLFGDHIVSLDIVDSDGKQRTVTKDNDANLFYAILGGSPGNYCIVTHFTFEAYSDDNYKDSRGLRGVFQYSSETLNKLLDILVRMAKDKDFPRNYDLCISVVSTSYDLPSLIHYIKEDPKAKDLYTKLFAANNNVGQKFTEVMNDTAVLHPRAIVVYAQYVNFPGDKCDESWFNEIINSGKHILMPKFQIPRSIPDVPILRHLRNLTYTKPMSQLTKDWIFLAEREYNFPYIKRTYLTKSDGNDLEKSGWAKWVTGRIDEIISKDNNRCWLSVQIQHFGGNQSKFFQNRNNGTSYSWRDSNIVCILDCFYDDETEGAKETAEKWQDENDKCVGPNGIFSKDDRRVFWGSYQKKMPKDKDEFDMNNSQRYYYDSDEKYNRLRKIKEKEDKNGIFTPNKFSIRPEAATML